MNDYRPPWARDLTRRIERLTERVVAARIIAHAIIEGQEAKALLMLKACKRCGGTAVEQVRRAASGDPGWLRSEARIVCATCGDATHWNRERTHHARWNADHGKEPDRVERQQPMTEKMSNLDALAGEIDKLTTAIEGDAKKRIEKIAGVWAKKDRVFAKADTKIDARDAAIDATDKALDKLDAALGDNGGPALPTSGGS